MKKIVFYISDLEKGGAQRVVSNLANYLAQNHDVTIITTISGNISYKLDDRVKYISLDNHEYSPSMFKSSRIINIINRLITLVKIINSINPDVTVTFLTREIYRILLINHFIKTKNIISFRNDPNTVYNNKFSRFFISVLVRLADGIVFQTSDAKSYFSRKVHNKSVIIKNPINEQFLVPPFKGTRKKQIVTVGKLFEQKNHKLLIEAFSKILGKFPEYKLYIYGEGALRTDIETQIRNLKIEDNVFLPGIKDDIKNYIYDSSLFVLSSNYEGVSNALLEAMTLGLPVISTDCPCGGSKELIQNNKNGILVPVNDVQKLSEAIEKVLSDKEFANYLSNNVIEIQNQFRPSIIYKQWEDYILLKLGG